ncbi:hypothetical protein Aph01nite_08370 [Acrocarpospora phusangensis]|uniref:Uncharacterized protein n=1 Tax=Acrocarpospora phusangensis TaxID=1070424 RepID=A0A919Q9Y1_9ACTN|nr:hypothetical protein [Acrocarpospora phusangensis]GIH22527.1 hypothetical protein Aph01nite_08370 [Acrocarpospora phusangensis]
MDDLFVLDLPGDGGGPQAKREAAPPAEPPARELPADGRGLDRLRGPIASAWADARADSAARKHRGGNRRWPARWMREQPTSVADLVDYALNQREERPDGRPGWGWRTAIPILNTVHDTVYVAWLLTWGLACTFALYALAWMQQRPGRSFLFLAGVWIVSSNLSTWSNA